MPTAPRATGPGWSAARLADQIQVVVSGDWIAREAGIDLAAARRIVGLGGRRLAFDCGGLRHWDSGLIVFLVRLQDAAGTADIALDQGGLPASAQRLLALTARSDDDAIKAVAAAGLLQAAGNRSLALLADVEAVTGMVGASVLQSGAAVSGHSLMQGPDLITEMRAAGVAALPIVLIVNTLVGGILAFVGAIQLRRFNADIYVAGLVGISVVREMAALMSAIVMSGRTGGAYAATLATMQANEELDALRAFGVPLFDILVLPRLLALSAMLPLLYLYGCAAGIIGGFVVAVATLHLSPESFVTEIRHALSGSQFVLGLAKSLSFGALIALIGCRCGLRAGRSANDIGRATTGAVVTCVVGVIVVDAVFALCANALHV